MPRQVYKELIKQGTSLGAPMIRSNIPGVSQQAIAEIFKSGPASTDYDFFQRLNTSVGDSVKREIVKPETWPLEESTPLDVNVAFQSLAADGDANTTTTKLTLQFDQDVPGLSIDDIILT